MQPLADMADPARYAGTRRIVRVDHGAKAVTVAWDDGGSTEFHPLWLRSECACPECRSRVTLERTFDHFRLPLGLTPTAVGATAEGALRVVWPPDGHVSLFDPGWLWSKAGGTRLPPRRFSGARTRDALPIFEHARIMSDDRALHAWLVALRDVGLALLRGVPVNRAR